jgi:hypothetical protein
VCQACASKVEELENFYSNCHNAQATLAVQYGVQIHEHADDQSLMMAPAHSSQVDLGVKDTNNLTEVLPISGNTITTLSADKLLETAIKDTGVNILSEDEEESEDEDDSLDVSTDDDQSGDGEKVSFIIFTVYSIL